MCTGFCQGEGCQWPWSCSYRRLWAVRGMEIGSSVRAVHALNLWAISPAPRPFFEMKKRISGCHHWALFDQTFSSLALTSKDFWWFMRINSSSRYKDLLTRNIVIHLEKMPEGQEDLFFFSISILLIENSLMHTRETLCHWAVAPDPHWGLLWTNSCTWASMC